MFDPPRRNNNGETPTTETLIFIHMELFHDDAELPTTPECTSYTREYMQQIREEGQTCREKPTEEVRDNHLVKT